MSGIEGGEHLLEIYFKEEKKKLSQHKKICENCYESRLEGLTLQQYLNIIKFLCKKEHKKTCKKGCKGMAEIGSKIVKDGFILLKEAFTFVSPGSTYTSLHARRKLLRMPLAAVGVGKIKAGTFRYFLVEKGSVRYEMFQCFANKLLENCKDTENGSLSKTDFKKLLQLAESDSEKERLKFVAIKAGGLSSTRSERVHGFRMHSERQKKVLDAMEHAEMIKESVENIAKIQDKALVRSLGFSVSESEDEMKTSSSESDSDDQTNSSADVNTCTVSGKHANDNSALNDTMSDEKLLEMLINNDCNWFQFVMVLRDTMNDTPDDAFNEVMGKFGERLPSLHLTEHERMVIEQSRQAYLITNKATERESAADESIIVSSESEDSETELLATKGVPDSPMDDRVLILLRKRRAAIKRKACRKVKAKIAAQRFLRKRRGKRLSKIISECKDIGEAIEEYVRECGVGADAWRRTGVLTFDGNRKVRKKATFQGIKEFLENKYQRNFAYGSVVQLCVARNKRRKSAIRYKGIARIVSRRARKGFSLRYNPDCHWSSALYSGLNMIQLKNGYNVMNLGRDDQAGFRLDTMATHKLQKTLCLKESQTLTTYTDYVTKYPSTLQTSSYNFPATSTTGEVCAGVVKAAPVHKKNAAQHYADLKLIQEQELIKAVFTNCQTGLPKTIECIRVDGGGDEGPAHVEVQYWWTVRHIEQASELTMVTSRNSGASYRNRVELQNGCQALAHANLFIPSTLNGSCLNGSGGIDKDVLEKNLDSAIDVYISRVDGAPCSSTSIHLYKGRKSDMFQKENDLFKVFLRGTKQAKEDLMKTNPDLYAKFERVWGVRDMHLAKSYPHKYIFLLQCCYKDGCVHPRCAKGSPPEENNTWYANGPPISFIPVPTPDPHRPFGQESCQECKGKCSGHYMKPDKLWEHVVKGGKVAQASPPSEVILATHQQHKGIPPRGVMKETAKKVLLPLEEVEMWFQHLQQSSENRARGAKKAAETRKRNARKQPTVVENASSKSNKTLQKKKTTEQSLEAASSHNEKESVCTECNMGEPPDTYIDDKSDISWIQCDGCDSWFHINCLGLLEVPSDTWLCCFCNEQW